MSDKNLVANDLTSEAWREYEFGEAGARVTYRIHDPKTLFIRVGGSTHRVVDAGGVVHLLPGPGYRGCVIRWQPRDQSRPVDF